MAKTKEAKQPLLNKVNTVQAKEFMADIFRAGLVPMLEGPPGVGKSGIVKDLAQQFNLKLVDLRLSQCDPTDLNGFPHLDPVNNKATYVPMDTFPLKKDPLPGKFNDDGTPVMVADGKGGQMQETYAGWLLFFDEFNSASMAVQAASYKIVLDHKVGQHDLHPNVIMACAGNQASNGAIVNRLSTAMQSRLVHLELIVDHASWTQWASENKLDHRVIAYVGYKPENLHRFKPSHDDKTFACPRTWEFTSSLCLPHPGDLTPLLGVIAGTISTPVANEFNTYTQIYKQLPTITDILTKPLQATVSGEPGMLYAVSGLLATNATAQNIGSVMAYTERLPPEFQIITLQDMLKRDVNLMKTDPISNWVAVKGEQLF